jgi:Skp family chaperone for outer membrane proteins
VNKRNAFLILAAVAALAGCTAQQSPVGLVDVSRLTANWPKYLDAQNQLNADEQGILASKGSRSQKQRQVIQLQQKYAGIENDLVKQVRDAATKVAGDKQLKLVLTRQFVGYGGTDITPDVEKILGITEKATPSP